MTVFDNYIKETAGYVEKMRDAGRLVRDFACTGPFPFRVGPGAGSPVILKSDTFLELGSPATASCSFVLYSNHTSLVRDGRIRLIGPDISESPSGAALSFGQVIMATGRRLTDKDYHSLVESQYIGDKIEGYMIRSMPGRIWSRISNEVAQKGFSLDFLGRAMIALIKAEISKVTAAEVLFVISGKSDVLLLSDMEAAVSDLAAKIKSRIWKKKGIDISECPFGGHCGLCKDRSVCDTVKRSKALQGTVEGKRVAKVKRRVSP